MVEAAWACLGIPPRMTVISPLMMRFAGLFIPAAKESVEMMYEFANPFVVDSGRIERELGLLPAPIEMGLEQTVSWYAQREAT